MFGSQEEITNKQTFSMIVNIVGCNYLHESIISTFMESLDPEYVSRFRVISLLKSDQLLNTHESNKEPGFGLLNMTWMRKTLNYRAATVIVVFDLRNKSEAVSLKDYENSIFSEITKIKKSDNYSFTNIVLIIYNNTNYTFDSYSEDKERPYNLKKVIDSKNIFYIYGVDGLKNISKKFTQNVIKLCLNYYRTIKKNLKLKKNNSSETNEKVIKYNIKLGVISQIKNRRKNMKYVKYFEEAYNMLNNIDIKNYFYGSHILKWNYLEIKSVADWLLFRIIFIKSSDIQNSIQSIVNMFVSHLKSYSKIELFTDISEKSEQVKSDLLGNTIEKFDTPQSKNIQVESNPSAHKLVFIEYYWSAIRYEFFAKFLEENFKSDFYIINYLNFPGYHYMVNTITLKCFSSLHST